MVLGKFSLARGYRCVVGVRLLVVAPFTGRRAIAVVVGAAFGQRDHMIDVPFISRPKRTMAYVAAAAAIGEYLRHLQRCSCAPSGVPERVHAALSFSFSSCSGSIPVSAWITAATSSDSLQNVRCGIRAKLIDFGRNTTSVSPCSTGHA